MSGGVWLVRLSALFQKKRLDHELDDDIRAHLQMAVEENLCRGMSASQAVDAAKRSFGGIEQVKEEVRDQRGIPILEMFVRETQFAFRSLRNAPGFTLLAILTLAIGIGANSAIFSAVNALLLNPGGVSNSERVVVVRAKYDKLNLRNIVISLSDFKDIRDSKKIFSATAIAQAGDFNYQGGAYTQRLAGLRVTWQWFDVLGVQPVLGRLFRQEEDDPNNNNVVVLSYRTWQRLFGMDPSVIGETIELDQVPYKVIGIIGREYDSRIDPLSGGISGQPQDIFVPLGVQDGPRTRFNESYLCLARLRGGIPFDMAQAVMGVLTERGFQAPFVGTPRKKNGWSLFIVRYADFIGGDLKTPMFILWGAVGLVLLIACSNIAGLTLARTSARSRELAIRTALGGSPWHLMRQVLIESLTLALGGSIVGLGVAYAFVRGVETLGPENVVNGLKIPFDAPMLIFTAAAGILSGFAFGIAPAGQFGRRNPNEALKEGGRSGFASRDRARLRSVLVTTEVSLALVLSVGAGLFLRSLLRLQQVDTGFRRKDVMSANVTLPQTRYKEPNKQVAFYRAVIERLTATHGVQSAAAAYPLPFGGGSEGRAFQIIGRPIPENGTPDLQGDVRWITPEFFSTLGIPIKRGRAFTEQDAMGTERVTIIDESLVRQYWPNENPLGQQIVQGGVRSIIVGIVGHTKQSDLGNDSNKGVFYYSLYQQPLFTAALVVHAAGTPTTLTKAMQETVNSVDPAQPIYDAKTMQELVSGTLAGRRFTVMLLALFAAAAVFLAALGLYGVISYGVTQRTQEIGIRMTLGAQRNQVLRLIVGQGMRITLIGLAFGLVAAFGIARILPSQLFGVSAFDPMTFAAMAIALAAVALFASYIPARRATRLDPLEACRYE